MQIVKQGYKQTEIGIIPEDWEVNSLIKVLSKIIDNRGKTPPYSKDSGIELIESASISFVNQYPDYSKVNKFVSKSTYDFWFRGHPVKHDILISTVGEYSGSTAIINENRGTIAQNLIALRINELNPNYVFYWTKSNSFKKQLDQVMMNQAQPSLRVPWLLNFQLIYPLKLQEQTAIATALSDIDALIGELDKLIAKKQGIKQATMQQLLTGKKRLAGFGSTSKYKQTEIGIIPEDWEVETLRNIAYFTNGKAHEQFINETGNYIVINSKFVSTEGKVFKKSVSALALLETGDIAMVMSDIPNGKALAKCFFVDENNKYTLNQRICSIKSSACNNIFLFWKLNRNKYFLAFDSGSGQTNLKKKEVLDCPIAIPPTIEEQTAIANILSDMDAEISQLEGRRAKMGELKQGMMQELLTGRIRLNTQDSTRC